MRHFAHDFSFRKQVEVLPRAGWPRAAHLVHENTNCELAQGSQDAAARQVFPHRGVAIWSCAREIPLCGIIPAAPSLHGTWKN